MDAFDNTFEEVRSNRNPSFAVAMASSDTVVNNSGQELKLLISPNYSNWQMFCSRCSLVYQIVLCYCIILFHVATHIITLLILYTNVF